MTWFPQPALPGLRGGPSLRWGVLAPGEIAGDFVDALAAHTDQQVVAVASRSAHRAEAFALAHGIERAYSSYAELVADPTIDIVYVAAPHAQHKPLALLAIRAGKHVLVEKPLALDAAEATEIMAAATDAGVLVAEGMWTRYLPQFDVLQQVIERGDLGDVRLATADVGWQAPFDPGSRLYKPELGGGAALDMGVYGFWFAQLAIGTPVQIAAVGSLASTGVDVQSSVALAGPGGRHASVTTTMLVTSSGLGAIHGTDGCARFLAPFVFPAPFVVTSGAERHDWRDESGIAGRGGLAWQAAAIASYVAEGRTDSPVHSLERAIAVLSTIDVVRDQLAIPPATTSAGDRPAR